MNKSAIRKEKKNELCTIFVTLYAIDWRCSKTVNAIVSITRLRKENKMKAEKAITHTAEALEKEFNPYYTFENFVVGKNNEFAHSAAVAVAENPGQDYNPLFLYGGAGLGKTHLMHSIGHFILEQNPKMRVLYVTSEQFTNEVIESIRETL